MQIKLKLPQKRKKTGDILDKFVRQHRGLQLTSVYSTSWYIICRVPVEVICLIDI
jgi:hypothetical protein